jgi:hypothetical protein
MVAHECLNVTLYAHCLFCICVGVNRDVVIDENYRVCCEGRIRSYTCIYDGKNFSEMLHKTYTSKTLSIINKRP